MPTKSIFTSMTFWFGALQVLLGGLGLVSGLMEQGQAMTLIMTGVGTIGLRIKTESPVTLK